MRVVPFSKLVGFHGRALLGEVASRSPVWVGVQPGSRPGSEPVRRAEEQSEARFERLDRTAHDYFRRGAAYVVQFGVGRHQVAGGATVEIAWQPGLADRIFPNGVVARGRPDRYLVRIESDRGTVSLCFHPEDPENLEFQTPDLAVSRRRSGDAVVIELVSSSDVKTLTRQSGAGVTLQRRPRLRQAA